MAHQKTQDLINTFEKVGYKNQQLSYMPIMTMLRKKSGK
jgi:hypothetical protein